MIHNSIFKNRETLSQTNKNQKGQGMTEYLAATALIGIAAIGTLGAMGDVIQNQFSSMTLELSGKTGDDATTTAGDRATDADDFNTNETGLGSFADNGSVHVEGE
jgi:Flp pilus assembly pilin Flp